MTKIAPEHRLLGLKHAALGVTDLARASQFYYEILDCTAYHAGDPDWMMMNVGPSSLSLVRMPAPEVSRVAQGSHVAHLGFVAPSREAVDAWHVRLRSASLKDLGTPKEHRDGSYGFYFRDPDQNMLELIYIPYETQGDAPEARLEARAAILIAHGSSDPQWRAPFARLLERLRAHSKSVDWELAYMESAEPTALAAAKALCARGHHRIRLIPAFVSAGAHVAHDLPRIAEEIERAHTGVRVELRPPLGAHPWVQDAWIAAALDEARA
jgi:sirohydrochlorin cobaltochelatase